MLITSLSVVTTIMLGYTIIYFVSKLLNENLELNIKNIMFIILFSIIIIGIHNITDKTISIILYFLILLVVTKLIFNTTISKAIMTSLMCYLVLIISDASAFLVCALVKINPLQLSKLEMLMLGNIMVLPIVFILTKIKILLNVMNMAINKSEVKIIKYILLSLLIIGILYTFIYYNISEKNLEIILMNILIVTLFAVLLIKLYVEQINKNNLKVEYDKMSDYVKIYEDVIEKARIRRHENKNQLVTIKGMISPKDKRANEYIDSLIADNSDKSYKWLSELKNIPIGGLKGLLFYKVNKMRENNIEVSLTISRSLENSKLQNIDTKTYKQLCQIIGVYIDNAIEACLEAESKSIGIEIYKDEDIFEFIISNTYKGNIQVDNIDAAGYTTKGNGHGYGLSLVRDIINSNAQFFQNRELVNEYYIQHLFLDLTDQE